MSGAKFPGRTFDWALGRCRRQWRRVNIDIINADATEGLATEAGRHAIGKTLINVNGSLGQWIFSVDELHAKRVQVRGSHLARQPQDFSVCRTNVVGINPHGRQVVVAMVIVALLQPEGGLDRRVFLELASEGSARINFFRHQRTLIHCSTPFVLSATALNTSRASGSVQSR